MPAENYYWSDNFFTKMTDLESPKKNNDCYFYYYSTCSKGDSCGFRHEPSALGCETMCSFWKEGKCLNIHCNFRHMELRKNRKVIPCYWEAQPGGCLKPHCPFMHQTDQPESSNEGKINKSEPSTLLPENCTQAGNYTSSVDSIVVNFEEESDNESGPTMSPAQQAAVSKVKTLEEIKLEKIAAACAAYYSYNTEEEMPDCNNPHQQAPSLSNDDLRQRILQRVQSKDNAQEQKLSRKQLAYILGDSSLNKKKRAVLDPSDKYPAYKKRKTTPTEVQSKEIKIKTLQEIRASRQRETKTNEIEDSEVTSTSNEESEQRKVEIKPLRRLNLTKIKVKPATETIIIESLKSENVESTSKNMDNIKSELEKSIASKTVEESLLLLDDDMDEEEINDVNLSVKSEDDLFEEIDHLLKN